MEKKQILLVNDMVGHSKVGMGAMIPVLSRMGHITFSLPTAVVSNTFNYGDFAVMDTTAYIREALPVWQRLGFGCDAVCTGWMYSREQADLVAEYCREQRQKGTQVFVDPVLADGGRLYNGITESHIAAMREMVSVADVAIPNYTEAAILTHSDYKEEGLTEDEAQELLQRLTALGCQSALITSCRMRNSGVRDTEGEVRDAKVRGCEARDARCAVVGFDHTTGSYFQLFYDEIPGQFHGTGDMFASILIGRMLQGASLKQATREAMDFVYRLIDLNRDLPDRRQGILIENFLHLVPTEK